MFRRQIVRKRLIMRRARAMMSWRRPCQCETLRADMLLTPQLDIKNAKLNVTSSTPHQPSQLAFSLRRLLVRGFNVAWATFFQRRKIFTFFFRSTGGKSAIIIKLNYPASAFEGAQSASFLWESDEILISAVESGNICNLVFTAPSS